MTLRHRCSLVTLLHIFKTPFYSNTYGKLPLRKIFQGNASFTIVQIHFFIVRSILEHGNAVQSLAIVELQ